MVNGPPRKVKHTRRSDTIRPEEWPMKETKTRGDCSLLRRTDQIARNSTEKRNLANSRCSQKFKQSSRENTVPCIVELERSEKPDTMPMFRCFGKLEAMNVSKSAVTDGKPHTHVERISGKRYGTVFH